MYLKFCYFVENILMDKDKELQQLRSELASAKKEIRSLSGKLDRCKKKVDKQKAELKKKETKSIELTDEQLTSLSSRLPGIDILNLLSD